LEVSEIEYVEKATTMVSNVRTIKRIPSHIASRQALKYGMIFPFQGFVPNALWIYMKNNDRFFFSSFLFR